ncbi:MAG TPA: heparinase II/III family protein, partial [Chitinophagaceae bacterium]|nr:heparinase II/III family protein [Chitinophagaceae bacterium]
ELKDWFNLLHNHAVWACAGVGIIGIATHNQDYTDMALYGTAKDGKRGFIAQMDNLFSPDGYYTEGPYYTRYAILPYALFANALNNYKPGLKIFEHRDRILLKALRTCLQQTNTNGSFFPLSDALKDKDYTSNELVTAIDIFWNIYGPDTNFLYVARQQNRVMLNTGGVAIASRLTSGKGVPAYFNYKTIESTDGTKGDEGGVSFIRNGITKDLTTLIFKYTSHGLSHGHFDRLNINLFDKGNEILTDYGSVRFIGVEQKYGGRYLPENKNYAAQTIAHNTIVIDEASQFNGDEKEAEKYHADKLFSNVSNPLVQVVAAKEIHSYKDVSLQRTLYSLQLPDGKKMIVDVFNTTTSGNHQFDLPFQYNGQLINTSFTYQSFTKKQEILGNKNGYQFLWKEAEAMVANTTAQFTFLNAKTYYTISTLVDDTTQLFFTRSGANDPDFNLRREPAFIVRKKGQSRSFINVLEIHGKYDPVNEFSSNAYPSVKQIKLLEQDDQYTIAEIIVGAKKLIIAQCNKDFDNKQVHAVPGFSWPGPFMVLYDGKKL